MKAQGAALGLGNQRGKALKGRNQQGSITNHKSQTTNSSRRDNMAGNDPPFSLLLSPDQ